MLAVDCKVFVQAQVAAKLRQVAEETGKHWTDESVIQAVTDYFYCQGVRGPVIAQKFEDFIRGIAAQIHN